MSTYPEISHIQYRMVCSVHLSSRYWRKGKQSLPTHTWLTGWSSTFQKHYHIPTGLFSSITTISAFTFHYEVQNPRGCGKPLTTLQQFCQPKFESSTPECVAENRSQISPQLNAGRYVAMRKQLLCPIHDEATVENASCKHFLEGNQFGKSSLTAQLKWIRIMDMSK
jgi:hypothetical protein